MRNSKLERRRQKKIFLLSMPLIMIDLILLLLSINHYYFTFLKPTGYTYPLILNFIYLILLAIFTRNITVVGMFFLPVVVPVYLLYSMFFAWVKSDYAYIDSPNGSETLIVEYRVAAFKQVKYHYSFYQETLMGLLMKKLDKQNIVIVDRSVGELKPAEDVLGIDNCEWVSEDEVIFHTPEGEKMVIVD